MDPGGLVVEPQTPEQEDGCSRPTSGILCHWARHIYSPNVLVKNQGSCMSQNDWKIVDRDNQHQFKPKPTFLQTLFSLDIQSSQQGCSTHYAPVICKQCPPPTSPPGSTVSSSLWAQTDGINSALHPILDSLPRENVQSLKPILITCPYNEHPLTPHFYIGKLGFTWVYIFFLLIFAHWSSSNMYPQSAFWEKIRQKSKSLNWTLSFLQPLKFAVYCTDMFA